MSDVYAVKTVKETLAGNPYVGRGIITGLAADGERSVFAYFIMGRSENSRNRVFIEEGDDLRTAPYDESKVKDPSLIIYYPVRTLESGVVVTNGDQTDTAAEFIKAGKSFSEAMATREFEPDAPNFTPRISAYLKNDPFSYEMSILKSADAEGTGCNRFTFSYSPTPGVGHFLHTYETDGNPLPTFRGEPERVFLRDSVRELAYDIWENLDEENKISLYVRFTDLKTGRYDRELINKNV
ncbi:MAG: IMP cyclohydrolase [Clostridia bacterium]|nr:IMP cyclohydrolase [Clostridia bacterium]